MNPFCHTPECPNYREGSTDYCSSCNRAIRKAEHQASQPVKLNARIKPIADKRALELAKYSRLRVQYIGIHQICEVVGCNRQAVDIHHQKGRENDLLLDTNFFMAICREHHIYYTEHSKEAIEQGVSYKRN
jgi:cytochrome oxidase assembly protein ShyY1